MTSSLSYMKKGFSVAMVLLTVSLTSCSDIFDQINKDPLNPEAPTFVPDEDEEGVADIDLNSTVGEKELEYLKSIIGNTGSEFRKFLYEGMYNDYQRTTNLTHDVYAGYFACNNTAFLAASPGYVYTEDYSGKRWDHFYINRSKEYSRLIRPFYYVDREKYANAYYITRIYYAFLTVQMVDTYGSIPFSDYVKGWEAPEKPSYDTGEKVYDMCFRILKQAVENIKPGECAFKFDANSDFIYQGDEEKWMRFANTLRLRMALRISNFDPEWAKKEGEEAIKAPGGLMQDQKDNMRTIPKYAPVDLGGLDTGGDENIHALSSTKYFDCVMSKDIELIYKEKGGDTDPRMAISWYRPTPSNLLEQNKENPNNDFNGCEIGDREISHKNSDKHSVLRCNMTAPKVLEDKNWFGLSRESVWLGYAESQFLLAEAALREWAGVEKDVKTYFEDGIKASMAYYNIPKSKYQWYLLGLICYDDPATDPFETNNKEGMLEWIIMQKWLAVFPNGNEGWAEFRRTDYPRLKTPLTNYSSDVAQGKFIKRVRYPNSEFEHNADNMPTEYIRQDTRIFWDVADTNDDNGQRKEPNNFRTSLRTKY